MDLANAMVKRLSRCRKKQVILTIITLMICNYCYQWFTTPENILFDLADGRQGVEKSLFDLMKHDKGMGCNIPVLDIFSEEVTLLERNATPITCKGKDWVKCYYSECRVVKEVLDRNSDIVCTYRDIVYVNDKKYVLGTPANVYGDQPYVLVASDHVKIRCRGRPLHAMLHTKWSGLGVGFRKNVPTVYSPLPVKKDSPNVLIFGYDSLSKNAHIRRMPKTYKYITEELKLTILHKYNVVNDGTPAALFPILTGLNEMEMPDARIQPNNNVTIDSKRFIFNKVKQHGYRTAYFEDMPGIGTFQYRFNGFDVQPADHYLRAFFQEEDKRSKNFYCVGSTLTYRLMMNLTDQFLSLSNSKWFILNFIGNVGHEDFDVIAQVDVATMEYLKSFKEKGYTKDTLLIFMGDHGSRYSAHRASFQGRIEERLPLMAILLPEVLREARPSAQEALELNSQVLTTPHDIHATLLDALDLTQYTIDYIIPGADFPRGMSLLKPIPQNRSCSEAGITPHWCTCTSWKDVSSEDPMYNVTAQALLDFINGLTEPVRSYCVPRTLKSIESVMEQHDNEIISDLKKVAPMWIEKPSFNILEWLLSSYGHNARALTFYFVYKAMKSGEIMPEQKYYYQVKIIVGPGIGVFEGTMTYIAQGDKFLINSKDISRTNRYNSEPHCIQHTHPHLNKFCYCQNQVKDASSDFNYYS